jgi:uncharacterized protein (DUF2249 family)
VQTTETPPPAALLKISAELIVDLDVREELRGGGEPFGIIMAARQSLPPGGVLRLRAIFEPVPLYHVMGKHGYAHWTEMLADDDWRVSFYPAEDEDALSPPAEKSGDSAPGDGGRGDRAKEQGEEDDVVILDVRGMEPPEPMVRTLAALQELPEGATLLQINVRVPEFLLPQLAEKGFTYEIREQSEELVRTFIRRRSDR